MVVCLYYKYCTKIYDKATIYANKLILTTLSPFILSAKNVMRRTSGNVFLGHLGGWIFHIFKRLHSILGCWNEPDTFQNFCGLCYNSQFKHYATSMMEFFLAKNRYWLETVVDFCYIQLRFKRDSFLDPTLKCIDKFKFETIKHSICHFHIQSQQEIQS